jgi:membrane protease YdiL (CAAX protease family)
VTHTGDALFRRALAGIVVATPIWAFVFRSKRANFWVRMTAGAGALGSYALWARPEQRKELPTLKDTMLGVASASGLYAIFQIGDRVARRIMPSGTEEIASVYELRGKAPTPLITVLLVSVIAPSEELFWRGMVQRAFMDKFGPVRGTLAASAAYGGIHLVTGNLTLTGAAATAGLYWGTEYALQPRLGPLLASHILWDVWIFLVAPTPGAEHAT